MADGILTPAVSVTSAVAGIGVAKPNVISDIIPISVVSQTIHGHLSFSPPRIYRSSSSHCSLYNNLEQRDWRLPLLRVCLPLVL